MFRKMRTSTIFRLDSICKFSRFREIFERELFFKNPLLGDTKISKYLRTWRILKKSFEDKWEKYYHFLWTREESTCSAALCNTCNLFIKELENWFYIYNLDYLRCTMHKRGKKSNENWVNWERITMKYEQYEFGRGR